MKHALSARQAYWNTYNYVPPVSQYIPQYASKNLVFSEDIGETLAAKIPKGKYVVVIGVGSTGDWKIAGQYAQFLQNDGYGVTFEKVGDVSPRPSHNITIDPSFDRYNVTIAPSLP
jgi:hypothetical protein